MYQARKEDTFLTKSRSCFEEMVLIKEKDFEDMEHDAKVKMDTES